MKLIGVVQIVNKIWKNYNFTCANIAFSCNGDGISSRLGRHRDGHVVHRAGTDRQLEGPSPNLQSNMSKHLTRIRTRKTVKYLGICDIDVP